MSARTKAASAARAVLGQFLANIQTLLFIGGVVALYVGVGGFSKPAANVVLGILLIVVSALPYMRRG